MTHRIAQFIGSFNQGGTERQAVALSLSLAGESRFDVSVATLDRSGVLLGEMEAAGFDAIPEFRLASFYDLNFFRQVRRCANWLREKEITLVHTHDFYTNIFGMAAASLARVPVRIASKRETGGMRSPMQTRVEMLVFSRADAVIANADAVREHLVASRVAPEKIVVIHNGLDLARFGDATNDCRNYREEIGVSPDAVVVTLVANLRHRVKNIPMLLRAAASVDAEFVIAGEGELETEYRSLAAELGVATRVHFIGRCTDVPALLAASDIGVLTSFNEGFSNSILEYMAARLPVVATDVGGASEAIIDGETGFIVKSDDDRELAARLNELIADGNRRSEFGTAAAYRARESFSREAQLDATIRLYDRLITEKVG